MARLMVFGGSGVIGRGVLEAASADARVKEIRALQRRPVSPALPNVVDVKVDDFANLAPHRDAFAGLDACIFALGIAQSKVSSEAEYRRITIDFALEAARRLAEASPQATFVYVSGQGADSSEKSRVLFARVKGEAENLLKKERVGRLVLARPGGVIPAEWPRDPNLSERLLFPIFNLFEPLTPSIAIRSLSLGRALVQCGLDPSISGLLTNRDLRRIADQKPQPVLQA